MKALPAIATVLTLSLTGCASLTSSGMQGMLLETKHNSDQAGTVCSAENERGQYILDPGKRGEVRRSRDSLHIECYNDTQIGTLDVPARRRNVTKLFNFMVDFCSITCTVDRRTGKGYGYTPRQTVYMRDR